MVTTYDQVGYEARIANEREILLIQLETKFGPLSPNINQRVEEMTPEELRQTVINVVKAKSLRDLGLEEQ